MTMIIVLTGWVASSALVLPLFAALGRAGHQEDVALGFVPRP